MQQFLVQFEKQLGTKFKCLHKSSGEEYMSIIFEDICDMCGIEREFTAPTFFLKLCCWENEYEHIRKGLQHVRACQDNRYLFNRSRRKAQEEKVHEEAQLKKPPYEHLMDLAVSFNVHVPKENHIKLDPKSRKFIFIGCGDSNKMRQRLEFKSQKIKHNHDVVSTRIGCI